MFEKYLNQWEKIIENERMKDYSDPKLIKRLALYAMNISGRETEPDILLSEKKDEILRQAEQTEQRMQEMKRFASKAQAFSGLSPKINFSQAKIELASILGAMNPKTHEEWSRSTDKKKMQILEGISAINMQKIYAAYTAGKIGLITLDCFRQLAEMCPETVQTVTPENDAALFKMPKRTPPKTSPQEKKGVSTWDQQVKNYNKYQQMAFQQEQERRTLAQASSLQQPRGKKSILEKKFKKTAFILAAGAMGIIGAGYFV